MQIGKDETARRLWVGAGTSGAAVSDHSADAFGLGAVGQTMAAQREATSGELEILISRVRGLREGVDCIGDQLSNHANKVFGGAPQAMEGKDKPSRVGLLGSLHDALDALNDAIAYAAEQAERNCKLG